MKHPERPEDRIPLRRRMRFRFLVALLGVAASAVVVTGLVQYLLSSRVMKENVAQRNLQIARRAASEITLFVRSSLSDLRSVEQGILPIRDPWVRDLILENTVTILEQFRSISVVSDSGEVLASSALENADAQVDRDLVREVAAGRGVQISPVRLSPDSLPYMTVALPTSLDAVRTAVLVAELDLRQVWDLVDAISFGSSGQAILVSHDGSLIAHPDKTLVLTSAPGSAMASTALATTGRGGYVVRQTEDGTPTLMAAAPIGEIVSWYVVVQQALREAWVPLNAMFVNTGLTILFFVAIAVLASAVLARGFATPLARLLGGTERIRAGDLSHRISIEGEDEIGRLSRSFNAMVQDLEERSRRLELSESRYRMLTESLSDIVFSLDEKGRILYTNPQVERILGFSQSEVEGRGASGFLVPAGDMDSFSSGRYEIEVKAADGRKVVLEVKLVRSGGAEAEATYYGVARDITERRNAEARLRAYQEELRALASQLSLTEARERKRIASEIHDRIGQTLALTRIKLGLLAGTKLPREPARMVREALPLLEQVIQDTRTLIFSVSSPLLYEVGLGAALERLVEQFNGEGATAFRYVEEGEMPRLDTDVAVLLFDAVKELLVNAVKHAKASTVSVSVAVPDGHVVLKVHDDGVGFGPAAALRRASGGYGLFSVRERIESMHGMMRIVSRRGRGTRVVMDVPVTARVAGHAAGGTP